MGKHHGSEGRKSIRITPKNSLMSLLKPTENVDFSYFFLCFLLLLLLLLLLRLLLFKTHLPDGKAPWQWRTEKPQNGTPKMPNVTSETQRKWWWNDDFGDFFLLLLLWILATFSSCFCRGFCCCCWSPDGKTPWQWRTAKSPGSAEIFVFSTFLKPAGWC